MTEINVDGSKTVYPKVDKLFNKNHEDHLDAIAYGLQRNLATAIQHEHEYPKFTKEEMDYLKNDEITIGEAQKYIHDISNNTKPDMVNHPAHYNVNGFEVIDIIKAFTEGLEGIQAVDTANAIKYILRWHNKNGVEDLKKARWYINHLIKEIENDSN